MADPFRDPDGDRAPDHDRDRDADRQPGLEAEPEQNVLGEPLTPCSNDPTTGFRRDGYCACDERDVGRHELCAVMTDEFLEFSAERGNDLSTARTELQFPGLEPGDRWCVCVPRWVEALEAVRRRRIPETTVPPVVLEATNESVLETVPMETLEEHAYDVG